MYFSLPWDEGKTLRADISISSLQNQQIEGRYMHSVISQYHYANHIVSPLDIRLAGQWQANPTSSREMVPGTTKILSLASIHARTVPLNLAVILAVLKETGMQNL